MTEKEIIFKSTSHPELTELMVSDPQKYQELSQQVVEARLSELLPIFKIWQKNRISMTMYDVSLRSIESQLDELNYSLYDTGIEGKRKLTQQFYDTCMCYPVEAIIEAAGKRSAWELRRIKNLINRSAKSLFNERFKAFQRLSSILGYTNQQIDNLPLLSFLPFRNPTIGIEWILMGDMDRIDDIVDDWILLLCLNNEMYSSSEFIDDLKKYLGDNTFRAVEHNMTQRIADKYSISKLFSSLRKRYIKQIKKLPNINISPSPISESVVSSTPTPYLEGYHLKQGIPFTNLIFGNGYMRYNNFIYRNSAFTPLIMSSNTQSELYIDVFLQNQPPSSKKKRDSNLTVASNFLDLKLVNDSDLSSIIEEISRVENSVDKKYENEYFIATHAHAEDFKVLPGIIYYKDKYYLKSVKITSEIKQSVLSQIKKTFCIKEDLSYKKTKGGIRLNFLFHPANDFSFFLAECERLKNKVSLKPSSFFPLNGEFELPWRYVSFYEGIMYLSHPNPSERGSINPFSFRHPYITKSFRDLMSYIEDRCPKFYVRAIDGVIVELLNFQSFQQMIPQFREYSSEIHGGIDELSYSKLSNSYSSTDFSNLKFVKKSRYLTHLTSLQVPSRKIYRILERVIHAQADTDFDEFGFLFTVIEYRSYSLIIYENASDESRSSILFQVRTSEFDQAIEVIRSFFASSEVNKRQRLAQSTIRIKSPAILSYRRILHTNFYDWRSNLSNIQ